MTRAFLTISSLSLLLATIGHAQVIQKGQETCSATERVQDAFITNSYNKYGGNSCAGSTDCESKCLTTEGCGGYTKVPSGTSIIRMSAGYWGFICVLQSDGVVQCLGSNTYGQLGDGTTTSRNTPLPVPLASAAVDVKCGTAHACALLDTGIVQCWGLNNVGQLGIGQTTTQKTTPQTVPNLYGVKILRVGDSNVHVILNDGTIKGWGHGANGQLGPKTNQKSPVTIDIGGKARDITSGGGPCAIMENDDLKCWGGSETSPIIPSANLPVFTSNVVKIGGKCVLKRNKRVYCWGTNYAGQLGLDNEVGASEIGAAIAFDKDVVDISESRNCATFSDGTVKCWGLNNHAQAGVGNYNYCYGCNALKMADLPYTDFSGIGNEVHQIVGREKGTCALVDGKVTCWGTNSLGACAGSCATPQGTIDFGLPEVNFSYVYGERQDGQGLTKDLSSICAPCNANEYATPMYDKESYIVKIGETDYTCESDAECKQQCDADENCAGYTVDKQLSVVKMTQYDGGWQNQIGTHNFILYNDGSVKCRGDSAYCGADTSGITYNKDDSSQWEDVKLSGPALDVVHVGGYQVGGCALMADGTLECWLKYTYNKFMFKPNNTITENIHVGSGGDYPMENYRKLDTGPYRYRNITVGYGNLMCGLLKDEHEGKIACFGYAVAPNDAPACFSNTPHIISYSGTVTDLVCDGGHCCVIHDGAVKCWGSNSDGQLGIGSTTTISTSSFTDLSSLEAVDIGTHVPAKLFLEVALTRVITNTGDLISWGYNGIGKLGYDKASYSFGDSQGDQPYEMGSNLTVFITNVKSIGRTAINNYDYYYSPLLTNDGKVYTIRRTSSGTTPWTLDTNVVGNIASVDGLLDYRLQYVTVDGFYKTTGGVNTPVYTPTGFTKIGLQCFPCADGSYNRPGDTTEGTCDEGLTCNENFYSDGTECLACPAGTISNGATVSDGSSRCELEGFCKENEYFNGFDCSQCDYLTFEKDAFKYTATPCQKEAPTCGEDEHSKVEYLYNNIKYTGATCTDCALECTSDANCLGYSLGNKILSISNTRYYGTSTYTTCAASNEGVRCWGYISSGKGGVGNDVTTSAIPFSQSILIPLQGVTRVQRLAVERSEWMAFFEDGTARCWGADVWKCGYTSAQNTPPLDISRPGPNIYAHGGKIKDIRYAWFNGGAIMLLEDGRVYGWGNSQYLRAGHSETDEPLDLGGPATAISAGMGAWCVVINAKVKCWGSFAASLGQDTSDPVPLSADIPYLNLPKPVVDIQSTMYSTCALFNDGTVKCWGNYQEIGLPNPGDMYYGGGYGGGDIHFLQDIPFVDITGVVQLSASIDHYCALLDTGGIKCWGKSDYGKTGTGLTEMTFGAPVQRVEAGYKNTYVIIDGNVKSFGWGAYYMLGGEDTTDKAVADAAFILSEVRDSTYGSTKEEGKGWAKRTVCTTCPENTTKPAGDSLAAPTVCAGMLECSSTEYYLANKCYCKADHHLVNGVCTPCSAGGKRSAGDDKETEQNTQCIVCQDYQHFVDGQCVDDTAYTTCNCASAACPESGALFFSIGTTAGDNSECRQATWAENILGQAAAKPKTTTSIKTLFSTLSSNQDQVSADKATKRNNFKSIVQYVKLQVKDLPNQRVKISKQSMVLSTAFLDKLGQREEVELVIPKTKTPTKLSSPTQACDEKDVDLNNQLTPYDVSLEDGEISLLCKGNEPVTKLEKLTSGANDFKYACWQNGAWQAEQGIDHEQNYQCSGLNFYVNSLSGITCSVTLPVSQSDSSIVAGTNVNCAATLSEGDTCQGQCGNNYVKVSDGQCNADGYQPAVCSCSPPYEIDEDGNCRLCDTGKFSVNGSACQPWTVTAKQCNDQGKLFVPGGETFDAACGDTCPLGKEPKISFCADITNDLSCQTLTHLYSSSDCCDGFDKTAECLQNIDTTAKQRSGSLASLKRADDSSCQEGDSIVYQNGQFVCTA